MGLDTYTLNLGQGGCVFSQVNVINLANIAGYQPSKWPIAWEDPPPCNSSLIGMQRHPSIIFIVHYSHYYMLQGPLNPLLTLLSRVHFEPRGYNAERRRRVATPVFGVYLEPRSM